ncbi:hypothetical protein RF11_01672 [Thelohanellus kitauei]|uniref:Uncharacterized protein n=1 Tax=Thelohanellus kitauei TaxID=669202 RepID=A0A0C2IZD5_THEKT|nr:hypothetical protein RF11_01672 [Thelohanellus kitauei]
MKRDLNNHNNKFTFKEFGLTSDNYYVQHVSLDFVAENLRQWKRGDGEEVKSYITELKMANGCKFGPQLERCIRDQKIFRIQENQAEDELMIMCQSIECKFINI